MDQKQKPEDITAEDERVISEYIRNLVKQAQSLGLSYDDWYVEFWDEPGTDGAKLYGAYAHIVRKADPKVHIYCNPTTTDIGKWYNEYVDISAPTYKAALEYPEADWLFCAPRFVRGYYRVATNSAKGERSPEVELYRRLAWNSICRGWNGWGFYSYYAPEGNPWSEFEQYSTGPDFQMVYPGPRGPVATRPSEALREGWEDYRLIELLKQLGLKSEVDAIIKAYQAGESMESLRLRVLRAADGKSRSVARKAE
jgi:hypothetical protein